MTSRDFHDWPAQEPPADFAERAVSAILAGDALPVAHRSKRRWPALLAVAVVFAGAGAWAAMGGWRPGSPAPVVEPPPPPAVPPPAETVEPVRAPALPREPTDGGVATVRVRPRPSATASGQPPPPEPPDAGRWIMVPSCTCSPFEGICSCVE
jgi:hypothetical protein